MHNRCDSGEAFSISDGYCYITTGPSLFPQSGYTFLRGFGATDQGVTFLAGFSGAGCTGARDPADPNLWYVYNSGQCYAPGVFYTAPRASSGPLLPRVQQFSRGTCPNGETGSFSFQDGACLGASGSPPQWGQWVCMPDGGPGHLLVASFSQPTCTGGYRLGSIPIAPRCAGGEIMYSCPYLRRPQRAPPLNASVGRWARPSVGCLNGTIVRGPKDASDNASAAPQPVRIRVSDRTDE